MRKISLIFILGILITISLSVNSLLFAQSVMLTETEIKEDDSAVKMLFSTNRSIPVECYDLSVPPQIVIDFMGEIYTNKPEVMLVNKDVVKQLRIIRGTRKSQDLDDSYYSVDFIIADLKEPTRYDFDQGLTTSVLVVSKPGKGMAPKQAKEELQKLTEKAEPALGSIPMAKIQEKPQPIVAPMPVQKEQTPPMVIETKEVDKPEVKTAKPQEKPKRRKQIKQKKIAALEEKTPAKSKPTAMSKMKEGIKDTFTFNKKRRTKISEKPDVKSTDKEAKVRRQTKIARKELEAKEKKSSRWGGKKSRREKPTKEKKAGKAAVSGEDAKYLERIDSAKQDIQQKQKSLNQVKEEMVRAEVALLEAQDAKETIGKRLENSSNKIEALKKEYNASVELTNYAKNAANATWVEYSGAKSKLSNLLSKNAPASEIKAVQQQYEERKMAMSEAIQTAESAKEESNKKLLAHNAEVENYNRLMENAENPANSVEHAQAQYNSAEQKVNSKKQELTLAEDELSEAENAYQQYKIEKADEEYRQSLLEIDMSMLQGLEDEQKQEEEEARLQQFEEERLKEEARLQEAKQAQAKEEAKRVALERLEEQKKAEDETLLRRRRSNISPKRRKSAPLVEKAPPLVERKPHEDVLKSAVELRNAGLEMQRTGDFDSAVKYYQQALISDPEYATVHNDLGILYEQKGFDDKAKMEYLNALKIDPHYYKAHSNLALLYEKSGDNDKAYYHWKQRVKLGREDDPWTQKARKRMERLEQRK